MVSTFNARDADVYERSMGRWSRRLAPGLIDFAELGEARAVLDVGCGPGSLLFTLAENPALTDITGIDASPIYTQAARARSTDSRITILDGDACAMPFEAASFHAALSQLVLQFVPDPLAAVREMRRVVKPGGTVAAAVWNSFGGMPHQRLFWDTAAMLDPKAGDLRAATFSRTTTVKGDLPRIFAEAGLSGIVESSATIWMDFENFQDFWGPIEGGEGTLGKYATSLAPELAERLKLHCRDGYEAGRPDGPRHFACTAFLCRGKVPA